MPNRPSSVQLQRASCFDDYSHGHAELLRPTWLHNAHSAPLPDPAGTVKHKCTPQVTNRRVICEKDGELFRQPQLQEHFINGSISRNWNRGLPGSQPVSDKAEAQLKRAVFASPGRCDVSDNWPAWWLLIFHVKPTLAVGRPPRKVSDPSASDP
jgi:hypothetical protein